MSPRARLLAGTAMREAPTPPPLPAVTIGTTVTLPPGEYMVSDGTVYSLDEGRRWTVRATIPARPKVWPAWLPRKYMPPGY